MLPGVNMYPEMTVINSSTEQRIKEKAGRSSPQFVQLQQCDIGAMKELVSQRNGGEKKLRNNPDPHRYPYLLCNKVTDFMTLPSVGIQDQGLH